MFKPDARHAFICEIRELRLHSLRGDIQQCGMEGLNKLGLRHLLEPQYVHAGSEINAVEFTQILEEEYPKIMKWRVKKCQD